MTINQYASKAGIITAFVFDPDNLPNGWKCTKMGMVTDDLPYYLISPEGERIITSKACVIMELHDWNRTPADGNDRWRAEFADVFKRSYGSIL